jgi:RNA polymerase sigma factor (sigma-70 family)
MDSKLYNDIGKAVETAKKNNGSLTEQNLLYVVKVATDIANKTGADFDSLLAEGVIAMMKMEEKFDITKNDKFTKAAAIAVRGYMLNSINRQGSLVHIPANHMKGFKKGQDRLDSSKVEYCQIDAIDYDTLGYVDNSAFGVDRDAILQEGLKTLDINGRIAIEMKLHLGKYSEQLPSEGKDKIVWKYKNSMQDIADELEVPLNTANKIYKDAMSKLSKYCQEAESGM